MPGFQILQLDELPPQPCPCGTTRRAFAGASESVASQHLVEIKQDSQTHYHRRITEIYLVLEGEGHIELDHQLFPVKPLTAVYIPPGCRHRAVGRLKVIVTAIPAFDPQDEWVD